MLFVFPQGSANRRNPGLKVTERRGVLKEFERQDPHFLRLANRVPEITGKFTRFNGCPDGLDFGNVHFTNLRSKEVNHEGV